MNIRQFIIREQSCRPIMLTNDGVEKYTYRKTPKMIKINLKQAQLRAVVDRLDRLNSTSE